MDFTWLKPSVLEIHYNPTVPTKIVIALAGNGADALSELMRHGGGSETLLSQHMLYAQEATNRYLKGKPDKIVSGWCARQLAMAAYEEAISLRPDGPVAGIGCSSSLVKPVSPRDPEGERLGRIHQVFLAVQTRFLTKEISFILGQGRERELEEQLLAIAILHQVAMVRGRGELIANLHAFLYPKEKNSYHEEVFDCRGFESNAPPQWLGLIDIVHSVAPYTSFGLRFPRLIGPHVIMSGSFNPLHEAHIKMAEMASQMVGKPYMFDLSVVNPDKPALDYIEIRRRAQQFITRNLPLVISSMPRYVSKSEQFPDGSIFAMGIDTFERILDPKYYKEPHLKDVLVPFQQHGNSFVVFPRKQGEQLRTLESVISPVILNLIREFGIKVISVQPEHFCMDLSSTELRSSQVSK